MHRRGFRAPLEQAPRNTPPPLPATRKSAGGPVGQGKRSRLGVCSPPSEHEPEPGIVGWERGAPLLPWHLRGTSSTAIQQEGRPHCLGCPRGQMASFVEQAPLNRGTSKGPVSLPAAFILLPRQLGPSIAPACPPLLTGLLSAQTRAGLPGGALGSGAAACAGLCPGCSWLPTALPLGGGGLLPHKRGGA